MFGVAEIRRVWSSLVGLGPRKLIGLGIIGLFVAFAVTTAGYLLTRPQFELLYSGLDKQDVARIASALRDASITFDVATDGASVSVEYGQTSRARMLLAERGLPHNGTNGYEIFDRIGSLGLTSFMQEVTRLRALEGELARTIQAMQGVKAARVHLVMPEESTFRRNKQVASASVVVRLASANETSIAQAVRHLVASAVPGMTIDLVTVLNSDGAVLASGADSETSAPARAASLEKSISETLQDNIRRTLTPMVGLRNLNVSVAVRLNTDKRQTNETIFNPDSRVERSVRVVRENQTAQNSSAQGAAGVERNIPSSNAKNGDGRQSNEENQKREETTNYEVSSKQISTVSGAYSIDRLSVAVLINRAGLAAGLGDQANNQEAFEKRLSEVSDLVSSAAGLSKERGDVVQVKAVNFSEEGRDFAATPGPGMLQLIVRQVGSIVTGIAAIVVVLIVGLFVVRPVSNALLTQKSESAGSELDPMISGALGSSVMPEFAIADYGDMPTGGFDLGREPSAREISQRKIDSIVEADEDRAAAMLKDWIRGGAKA